MTLLALRRYDAAWPFYEARRQVLPIADPQTTAPDWRGEPLAGKTLAVVREQGLGDQIMFGRYLAQLDAAGAEVVLACDPRSIARLFESAGRRTRAYPVGARGLLPRCDYWCFFGSLPLRLTPIRRRRPIWRTSPAAAAVELGWSPGAARRTSTTGAARCRRQPRPGRCRWAVTFCRKRRAPSASWRPPRSSRGWTW